MSWEHLYVALSRVRVRDDIRILLKLNDRTTMSYVKGLTKNRDIKNFFQGYNYPQGVQTEPILWDETRASAAAGLRTQN